MHYAAAVAFAALAAQVSAHGVITSIQGANGVTMPGLSGLLPLQLSQRLKLIIISSRWDTS